MKNKQLNNLWQVIFIWISGILLFLALGLNTIYEAENDTENRLMGEAGRIAAQLASLLSLPVNIPDAQHIRGIIAGAMEDENIYAAKVEYKSGLKEGRRRNYLWEPVSWDDEIAENCIQGMTPIKKDGKTIGAVEIWLSSRQIKEEEQRIFFCESIRFGILAVFWTLAIWILLKNGINLKLLKRQLALKISGRSDSRQEYHGPPPLGLSSTACKISSDEAYVFSQELGRKYQRKNPDSWLIFAGLFRQTFAHAPELMNQLYANNDLAGLCHLGKMLEKIAPCLGSEKLVEAAQIMQNRLNDPESDDKASSVENCVCVLAEILVSLKN